MKKTIALLLLTSLSTSVLADKSSDEIYEQLAEAIALHKQAMTGNHGWVVTTRAIESAKQALAAEDLPEARVQTAKAHKTANASLIQMQREQEAWQDRVPGQ